MPRRLAFAARPVALTLTLLTLAGCRAGQRGGRDAQAPGERAEPSGSLDKDVIRTIVRTGIDEIRECYNQGLARDPNLRGRVVVKFRIEADGSVRESSVLESELPRWADSVAECLAETAKGWRFPVPEGGGFLIISYPFVLEPG